MIYRASFLKLFHIIKQHLVKGSTQGGGRQMDATCDFFPTVMYLLILLLAPLTRHFFPAHPWLPILTMSLGSCDYSTGISPIIASAASTLASSKGWPTSSVCEYFAPLVDVGSLEKWFGFKAYAPATGTHIRMNFLLTKRCFQSMGTGMFQNIGWNLHTYTKDIIFSGELP